MTLLAIRRIPFVPVGLAFAPDSKSIAATHVEPIVGRLIVT